MDLTYSRVDLSEYARNKTEPCAIVSRGKGEVWLVSLAQIRPGRETQWSLCQSDSHVHVPVVPYITQDSPELALAFFFGLGLQAALAIHKPVRRLHIAVGVPISTSQDPAVAAQLRCFMGFAVLLQN